MLFFAAVNTTNMAKEPDYRSMDASHLRYALKKLEHKILSITGDPLGNYHKSFEWAKNGPAMEKVQELMSSRNFILHLLFEKHCTPAEVARLEEVNALLLDLTNRTYKRTANLARTILSAAREDMDDNLTIEGKLVPEFDLPSSVLRLKDDSYYGSEFVRMAAILQETEEFQPGMADVCCYPSQLSVPFSPSITDEQLGCDNTLDDGTTWAEAWLHIPPLEHITICYALHALVTHMSWSIPDVLRINDYKIEVTATVQQFSLHNFKHTLLAECRPRPKDLPLETHQLRRCCENTSTSPASRATSGATSSPATSPGMPRPTSSKLLPDSSSPFLRIPCPMAV